METINYVVEYKLAQNHDSKYVVMELLSEEGFRLEKEYEDEFRENWQDESYDDYLRHMMTRHVKSLVLRKFGKYFVKTTSVVNYFKNDSEEPFDDIE